MRGLGGWIAASVGRYRPNALLLLPYSVPVFAAVISLRIIEMHRQLPDLIADLIVEDPLRALPDSGSSSSGAFPEKTDSERP